MKVGSLSARVTIQHAVDTPDGAGGATRVWVDGLEIWASVRPTGGKEGLIAGTLQQTQGFRVEIRRRSGVTTANRFLFQGRPLNILSIEDPDGRRESLVAFCETEVA